MKKSTIITALICSSLIVLCFIYNDKITDKLANFLDEQPTIIVSEANQYAKNYDYYYVKLDSTFAPYGYQDIVNIIYSTLNNGWDSFTFYCPREYIECVEDIKSISTNKNLLSNINNFVHPYNSFSSIKSTFDNSGEITLTINKLYTKEKINIVKEIITNFETNNINNSLSTKEKIKSFHDFVIKNAKYDIERTQIGKSNYDSGTAYGALVEGYAVCGGYSDAMAIFLYDLGIKNYKIASEDHVWNAVYLDDNWVHLDLTWDDPYGENGNDYLIYDYYLIDTEKLHELDTLSHTFDFNVYQEFSN